MKDEDYIEIGPGRGLEARAMELMKTRLAAKQAVDPDARLTPEDFAQLKAQHAAELQPAQQVRPVEVPSDIAETDVASRNEDENLQ